MWIIKADLCREQYFCLDFLTLWSLDSTDVLPKRQATHFRAHRSLRVLMSANARGQDGAGGSPVSLYNSDMHYKTLEGDL